MKVKNEKNLFIFQLIKILNQWNEQDLQPNHCINMVCLALFSMNGTFFSFTIKKLKKNWKKDKKSQKKKSKKKETKIR